MELANVAEFLKKVSEKTGFNREKYIEKNIPTSFNNIMIITFYGDMRGEFVLSSLLLKRIKDANPGKYFILCSYPGHGGFYPYIDEYWSLQDETSIRNLMNSSVGMNNLRTDNLLFQEQQLNRYFENVLNLEDFNYYDNGLTKEFFDKFKQIVYTLPSVASSKVEFNRLISKRSGYKVFLYPSQTLKAWSKGKEVIIKSKIEFWHELVRSLIKADIQPVVYQDCGSFDISKELENSCLYCSENKVLDILGTMRTTGCILDVFNGISRWALMARTPSIACVDRKWYNMTKGWEIDDLCGNGLPSRHIFSFPTIIENGHWNELITNIVMKLESFIPQLSRDEWPSTTEQSVIVPYGLVKDRKRKKIGTHFIKVPKI